MKIGIIGAGKVGTAIGHALQKKGFEVVAVSDVAGEKAFQAARPYLGGDPLYTSDNGLVATAADIIAITTQDGVIGNVAQTLSQGTERLDGKLIFHTSGAHPSSVLKPLDERGAILGSLHPLQTFPDVESAIRVLPGTYIFIEGDAAALPLLERLGREIGIATVPIEGKDKIYYHLSAVFVCNLLCALLYASGGVMDKAGITLKPFFPIIHATLKNIETKGPLLSLTGPVIRGDVGTVKDHLRAMDNMKLHRRIYKALSRAALDMVEERQALNRETCAALRRVLEENDE